MKIAFDILFPPTMGTTHEVESTGMKEQSWEVEMLRVLRGEDRMDNKRDGDVLLYSIGCEVETEGRRATELLQMNKWNNLGI